MPGSFDIAYLACLPDFVVMAAADEAELVHMVATAAAIDDRPSAFRFPRGEGVGVELPERGVPLEIGRGRIVKEGQGVAILSFGARLHECLKAAEGWRRAASGRRWRTRASPSRSTAQLILRLAAEHPALITIEEGSVGGFGSHVAQLLAEEGVFDRGLKFRSMVLPDSFIQQDSAGADVRGGGDERRADRGEGAGTCSAWRRWGRGGPERCRTAIGFASDSRRSAAGQCVVGDLDGEDLELDRLAAQLTVTELPATRRSAPGRRGRCRRCGRRRGRPRLRR